MLLQITEFFRKKYQVLNKIEISKSALIKNYSQLSNLSPKFKIAPVLKSNAYGHGIVQIGSIADKLNAPFLCVDSLYEAYQLHKPLVPEFAQKIKLKTPILIMGYTNPANLNTRTKLPFEWAIWDIDFARALNKYQKGSRVHIFVDTGMHREGVSLEDLPRFLEVLRQFDNITTVGLMSHLASCADPNDKLFLKQIANFKKAKEIIRKAKISIRWFHISASDPLTNKETRKAVFEVSNLARVGKALFGIAPTSDIFLQPVLQTKTQIVQIKKIRKGESIGYGGTFKASKDMLIAILPMGYNDGVDRRLSNIGVVLIDKVTCPIAGRISMNITTIDISRVKNPFVGQEVLVYSNNPDDPNSIQKVADQCSTIAHEILIRESPTTRRVVVE